MCAQYIEPWGMLNIVGAFTSMEDAQYRGGVSVPCWIS